MTSSIPVSAALLRNLAERTWRNDALAQDFEAGRAITKRSRPAPKPTFQKYTAKRLSRFCQKYGSDPERSAAMQRRRNYGSSNPLPPQFRFLFTQGEHAVLAIVGEEVRRNGRCLLCKATIAKRAGVKLSTVKNALREARNIGLIHVTYRPRPGQKHLSNIIEVIDADWLKWINRGIGVKRSTPYKTQVYKTSQTESEAPSQRAYEAAGSGFRRRTKANVTGKHGHAGG